MREMDRSSCESTAAEVRGASRTQAHATREANQGHLASIHEDLYCTYHRKLPLFASWGALVAL